MNHLTKQDKQFLKEAVFRFELAKREIVIKLGDFENIDGDDYEHHEDENQSTLSALDDYFDKFYSTHTRLINGSAAIEGETAEEPTTLLRNRLGELGTVLEATEQLATDTADDNGYYQAFVSTLSYTRHHSGISIILIVIAILLGLLATYALALVGLAALMLFIALTLVFDKFRAIKAAKKKIQNMKSAE